MSKAEEAVQNLGYGKDPLNRVEYTASDVWDACIEAYHQAEKDLELTWEDIKTIDKLLNQCVDYSNPYQEVLKRFKDLKKCI